MSGALKEKRAVAQNRRHAPKKKALTEAQRYEMGRQEGIQRGAARRVANGRRRTLEEVKEVLHDAYAVISTFARLEKRKDAEVAARFLERLRRLSPTPPGPREYARLLVEIEQGLKSLFRASEGEASGLNMGGLPMMTVPVTLEGREALQRAIAKRARMDLQLPEPPPARPPPQLLPGPGVIDFGEASARLKAGRRRARSHQP